MYSQRVSLFPAPGKNAEVRQILEERTRQRQAHGVRASLASSAFAVEPCFALTTQFEDLGALETYRDSPLGQPDPRVASLTGQPARLELYEILLQVPAASTPARFLQRVTITPLTGKGPVVQNLLVELVKGRQADGVRGGVAIQAAGPGANDLVATIVLGSLSEFGQLRVRNQTDTAFQQFVGKLGELTSRPAIIELFEIVVPLPPR